MPSARLLPQVGRVHPPAWVSEVLRALIAVGVLCLAAAANAWLG